MPRTATPPLRAATSPQRQCSGTTDAGAPCKGFAQRDSAFCLAHDPDRRAAAQAARAKGGTVSNKLRSIEGRRRKLTTAPELVSFTSGIVQDLLSGSVTVDVGRAVLYGISIQKSLLEASDLDTRLRALEAAPPPNTAKKEAPPWRP